jgi:hypothetical protein
MEIVVVVDSDMSLTDFQYLVKSLKDFLLCENQVSRGAKTHFHISLKIGLLFG